MQQANRAPLGKNGNIAARPGQRLERSLAWDLMRWLWSVSSLPPLRKCRRVRTGSGVAVAMAASGSYLTGLCHCKSIWACPLCAPAIRAARGQRLAEAVRWALEAGWGVEFVTSTVPHGFSDTLQATFSAVAGSWRSVAADLMVKRVRKALRYQGTVRAVEITYRTGWHPHLHALLFFERPLKSTQRAALAKVYRRAWESAVVSFGFRRPSLARGLRVLPVRDGEVADYVTRMSPKSVGHELTALSTKEGREGGRTPFEVLQSAALGDVGDVALWLEYERSTKGRNMLTWSPGLAATVGYFEADTDGDEVETEFCGRIEGEDWDVIRYLPGGPASILDAAEDRGFLGVREVVEMLMGRGDAPPDWIQEELF